MRHLRRPDLQIAQTEPHGRACPRGGGKDQDIPDVVRGLPDRVLRPGRDRIPRLLDIAGLLVLDGGVGKESGWFCRPWIGLRRPFRAYNPKMTALVFGGSGFIGSHVVARLRRQKTRVVVLDRNADAFMNRPDVTYARGEFGNRGELQKLLRAKGITEVVHLASSTLPETSNLDPQSDVRTNLEQTLSLLDMLVEHGARKIVFMSSGGTVYGIPKYMPVDEKHPTEPITSYGITKLAIENYLRLYERLHGLPYVVIRAANPYGVGQNPIAPQGVIPVFCFRMLRGETLDVWGDGTTSRDFFHVRDLADLVVRALRSSKVGTFNAGSGKEVSLNELIDQMQGLLKCKASVRYLSGRSVDVPRIALDCRLAREVLDWAPTISLEDGIREIEVWLRRHWLTETQKSVRSH